MNSFLALSGRHRLHLFIIFGGIHLHLLWFLFNWLCGRLWDRLWCRRIDDFFQIRILLNQVVRQQLQAPLKMVQVPRNVIVHMIPDGSSLYLHSTTIWLEATVDNTVHAGLQVFFNLATFKV